MVHIIPYSPHSRHSIFIRNSKITVRSGKTPPQGAKHLAHRFTAQFGSPPRAFRK